MTERSDVVVVGAGLMGAATAWSAARRGLSVTVLEQFQPGHPHGSSHGSARIVRRGYGDAMYTRLTGRAFELWREVESDTDTQLLRMMGGLDFGTQRNVASVAGHLAAERVEHEVLDAREAEARWPGMRFEGDVVFHPQAGTMDASRAVEAFLAGAKAHGAQLAFSAPVQAIVPSDDHVQVELDSGGHVAGRVVVVAAGGWVDPLLGDLVALPPLRVVRNEIQHFPRLDPDAPPWPSVIHEEPVISVYHLAGGRDGGPGDDRKLGDHYGGLDTTADSRDGAVSNSRERLIDYVRTWLPGLDPTPRGAATCLYTMTPSEEFLLDRVGQLVVCSPCSGHGAKFAPLIGELTADLAQGIDRDLPDRFRLATHQLGKIARVSL
ncbi:MAG TPA: FAD-dependent oxidoreductase [Jatrophihabitantaceae bacterium]|nr:FAD-dependent oxidoreductase [Jatrophihabitantaceae bacterium]